MTILYKISKKKWQNWGQRFIVINWHYFLGIFCTILTANPNVILLFCLHYFPAQEHHMNCDYFAQLWEQLGKPTPTPKGGHICKCDQNYEFDFINTLALLCSLFFSSCSRTPCDGSAQARQQVGRPTYHFLVFHWFFDFCISHVPVQTCLARILRKQWSF